MEMRKFHKVKKAIETTNGIDQTGNEELFEVLNDHLSAVSFDLQHCKFNFEDSFSDDLKDYLIDKYSRQQQFLILLFQCVFYLSLTDNSTYQQNLYQNHP